MHELPLLIFTLCLQGSVGVTVWLALGRQYAVEGRVPARGALPAMAGAFVLACVGLACFSAAHGLSPECTKCVTSCRQFVAESRNRLCQPLSDGAGTGG
ncbi:dimethyl sulfoxide reductase subunit C [Salmonella enterica subsp. enterica]|nr:dimethyl sulfoxide reductase subunit C [Salmonella enterica subsp. enterica]